MQRILIIVLIIIALITTLLGGAWWFLQRTIANLPISELEYRITALGYKHVRLEHLAFVYRADAESGEVSDAEPSTAEIPFRAEDIFISWQWQNFRPEVQIVELGSLHTTIEQWPQPEAPAEPDPASWRDWQTPPDWRLSQRLPHQVDIHAFVITVPCQSLCTYSGYLSFSSENKERFASIDEPQRSELTLQLSPHAQFNELEHVNLRAQYEVLSQSPRLDFTIQSPMAFHLSARQQITRNNELSANYALEYQPNAHWVYDHLWQWLPQFEPSIEPYLDFIGDSMTMDAQIQAHLPGTQLERWLHEISGQAQLTAQIEEQIDLNTRLQLERTPEINLHHALEVEASGAFLRHLAHHINPNDRIQSQPTLAAESFFEQPLNILAQWDHPLELELFSQFTLPPGTALSSWYDQAQGRVRYQLNSAQQLAIEDLGELNMESQGSARLDTGLWRDIDLWLQGDLRPDEQLLSTPMLSTDLGVFRYLVQLQQPEIFSIQQLPIRVGLANDGGTEVRLNSQFLLNASRLSVDNGQGQVAIQLPQLEWLDIRAHDMILNVPFAFDYAPNASYQLRQTAAANLTFATALGDTEHDLTPFRIQLPEWSLQGRIDDWQDSTLSAELDVQTTALHLPALRPVSWQLSASLDGRPLAHPANLRSQGRISNGPGLSVRYQAEVNNERLKVDWRVNDIFWLAGNPVAASIENWPELLQLQRGRSSADGTLSYDFASPALTLDAQVRAFDVAGIYDTLSFSGLRAEVAAELTPDYLQLSLPQGSIQRLEYGVPLGPGELSASYRAGSDNMLQGALTIGPNQLNMLNGHVALRQDTFHLDQSDFIFYVQLNQLDLARLLAEYPATELTGSGLLSGAIPVRWSAQGFAVEQGRISALPPGGQLQFRSERAQQVAQSNIAMQTLMSALDDFHYSELQGDLTYSDDGTLLLGLLIEGRNPALERGRPVRLEITLEEDLPALLASLQLTNQLNELIQERVQQRLIQNLRN